MVLISRGRIETRKCPRKYYLSYLYKGGSDSPFSNIDLFLGILTHKGMEILFREKDDPYIKALVGIQEEGEGRIQKLNLDPGSLALKQHEEAIRMAQAHIIYWVHSGEHASFLDEFEILGVESEYITTLSSNIDLFSKLDLAVREKSTGRVFVVNFKTAGDLNDWLGKWRYDIQMWTEALALEAQVEKEVAGCIVIGLKKGQRREGLLTNVLIYGYRKLGAAGPEFSSTYKKGWERFPVWEEERFGETPSQRIENWLLSLDNDVVDGFSIISPPILKNDKVVENWIKGVVRWVSDAEHINAEASEADKLQFFDQRFSAQNCKFCPFENVCMGLTTVDDLLKAGFLVPRSSPITEREKLLEGST